MILCEFQFLRLFFANRNIINRKFLCIICASTLNSGNLWISLIRCALLTILCFEFYLIFCFHLLFFSKSIFESPLSESLFSFYSFVKPEFLLQLRLTLRMKIIVFFFSIYSSVTVRPLCLVSLSLFVLLSYSEPNLLFSANFTDFLSHIP